jgi:DNA modification methylase
MTTVFRTHGLTLYHGPFQSVFEDASNLIDLVVTSPPYNIGSKAPKKTGGRRLGGFDSKSFRSITDYPDNMPEADYQQSQHDFLALAARWIKPNGVILYNHKPRLRKGQTILPTKWFPDDLVLHQEIIWDRGSTHNHSPTYLYPQSERIYVLKKPGAKIFFRNQNFFWETESKNKGCGDVWRIPPERGNEHNAPFPLKLARHCIRLFSPADGLVCDPYSGSGTTMIASFVEGRRCVGSERLLKYFTYSKMRIRKHIGEGTSKHAEHKIKMGAK